LRLKIRMEIKFILKIHLDIGVKENLIPMEIKFTMKAQNEFWCKYEYDSKGNQIYFENSYGVVKDNRPKPNCEGKIVEIEGVKYKLTAV
jgi:hypothetical protein